MASNSNELSASQYALRRKELLSLLKQLRATGSQGELDLPRITVIGNQSAGKSSVVEAISGITVPRDAGTCTRCPMECRLSSSTSSWSCQISVRREFDASGNILEKVSESHFGGVITDKKDVELALRRAQVAVLNPHLDPSVILNASAETLANPPFVSKNSLDFSRDTVCVDLDGPELTDLSFVDLPGLIQNAEPKTIQLVEDMVMSHIKGNCLILVALPMTDDIENQKALRLARCEDPDGRRTIGVMTKPDMLTAGSTKARDIWLDIIEGRRHPLVHGYYCTRQPDDAQRAADITTSQARVAEAAFFSSTQPWSTSAHKERFGTNHLISTLSKLLVGAINDALPQITSEASGKLDTCNRELTSLPKAVDGDPPTYMLKLLTAFCDDVQRVVRDGLDANQVVRRNRDTYAVFKAAIRQTAPNFIPAVSKHLGQRSVSRTSLELDTLTKSKPFFMDHMREHIRRSITRELPNNVPFSAKAILIAQFQVGWGSAIEVCFAAVRQQVKTMLEQLINGTFYRYEHLQGHIRIFVSEIVQKHHDVCAAILQPILEVEATPFTQNSHYLSETNAKWLAKYKEARFGEDDQLNDESRTTEHDQAEATTPANLAYMDVARTVSRSTESLKRAASDDELPDEESSDEEPSDDESSDQNVKSGKGRQPPCKKRKTTENGQAQVTKSAPAANGTVKSATSRSGGSSKRAEADEESSDSSESSDSNSSDDQKAKIKKGHQPSRSKKPSTTKHVQTKVAKSKIVAAGNAVMVNDKTKGHSSRSSGSSKPAASNNGSPEPEPFDTEAARKADVDRALAALAALGYNGLTAEDFGKLRPVDEYETELQAMAEVRGYFQIAYKRIIDIVPSMIDCMFVKAIANDMQLSLITKFALGTADANEHCGMYLAETPLVVAKRKELAARKERLEGVKQALHTFGLSYRET